MTGIHRHLRSILGASGTVEAAGNGTVRVAARTEEECALILSTATTEGWKVRVEGGGNWRPFDAPADVAISTRLLRGVTDLSPEDLLVTAQSGTPWNELEASATQMGMWIPVDPPGRDRTLGSVVVTGTAGALRNGFGPIRRQVLGLTLVCGDGRLVRIGGKVAKNVAGFDIQKLAVGSFGAYGIVTSVNLRLCALPQIDRTLLVSGNRDSLLEIAAAVLASGITPAALELVSPSASQTVDWTLRVRLVGSDASVSAESDAVLAAASAEFAVIDPQQATRLWQSLSTDSTKHPMSIRIGALPSTLAETLDLLFQFLGKEPQTWATACVQAGVIRWSGQTSRERLTELRREASIRKIPVTLERAPWKVLASVGHFGAYPDGVGPLVAALRDVVDARRTLVVPLEASP